MLYHLGECLLCYLYIVFPVVFGKDLELVGRYTVYVDDRVVLVFRADDYLVRIIVLNLETDSIRRYFLCDFEQLARRYAYLACRFDHACSFDFYAVFIEPSLMASIYTLTSIGIGDLGFIIESAIESR